MSVTWQALSAAALLLIGLGTIAWGILAGFAADMSDRPDQSNTGCAPIIIGVVLCVAAILGFAL